MKKFFIGLMVFASLSTIAQNVGIGTTSPGAKLDVNSTNSGILIPRVALSGSNTASPLTSPSTSTMIYNTATVTGASAVSPGFYYWNGSSWIRVLDAPSLGDATTNTLNSSTNTITSIINGVSASALAVNSNALSLSGTSITSTINNVGSNALDISSIDKNIYNADGTLTGTRTVTMSGNTLNFTGGNVGIGMAPGGPLDINGRASATSFKVSSNFTDLVNNAPWYGIGQSNLTLTGQGAAAVQIGGFYGINFAESGSNRMVINLGNVGIGTTNPTQTLVVNGNTLLGLSDNTAFGMDATTGARLGIIKKAGFFPEIASASASPIIFAQTNQADVFTSISTATLTERMRIDAGGNVGIANASPGQKLDVTGNIGFRGNLIWENTPSLSPVNSGSHTLTLAEITNGLYYVQNGSFATTILPTSIGQVQGQTMLIFNQASSTLTVQWPCVNNGCSGSTGGSTTIGSGTGRLFMWTTTSGNTNSSNQSGWFPM